MIIESRFQFPWMDFSHENQKNLDMVEELLNTRGSFSDLSAAIARHQSKPPPEARV